MFGKLYHTAAIVSIAIVLAGGAVTGLMYGTGKLTPDQIESIAKILRGESRELAAAQPDQTEGEQSGDGQANSDVSAEEIRRQRREAQLRRSLTERSGRDLAAQRELLDQALQHLIGAEDKFTDEQARARAEVERRRGQVRDEGFQKELNIVKKLSGKLAKEHLVRKYKKSPADAVRLLNALPESASKRIFGQMKSPEELQIMHELLERLTSDEVDPFPPGSGTAAGK